MNLSELYEIYQKHPLISIDSRKCPKDSLFFALKGDNFNGNLFAAEALANGSAFAVVDEIVPKNSTDERIIVVDNVLTTLQQLATHHRRKLKTPILAITGTNGKTTTKELAAAVLAKEYNVAFTRGNFNNHIGVPLTLLSLTKADEIAVVEMGANHPGEIKTLCEIAEPNFGLITNIGKAHIEGFGSFENIIRTKSELFDYIRKHSMDVFVNHDDKNILKQSDDLAAVMYGNSSENNLFVSGALIESFPFLTLKWFFCDKSFTVRTHLVGTYNLHNVLAAITIGKFFGINAEYINEALEQYMPKNNRSQFEKTINNRLYIDTYNANPTSMRASLEHFSDIPDRPRAVILGEMKELGKVSTEEHQQLVDFINRQQFEKVWLVGKAFHEVDTNFPVFENVESFIENAQTYPISGYTVLLKGSHSVHLEKCVKVL